MSTSPFCKDLVAIKNLHFFIFTYRSFTDTYSRKQQATFQSKIYVFFLSPFFHCLANIQKPLIPVSLRHSVFIALSLLPNKLNILPPERVDASSSRAPSTTAY